jgi:hypothetical protein
MSRAEANEVYGAFIVISLQHGGCGSSSEDGVGSSSDSRTHARSFGDMESSASICG